MTSFKKVPLTEKEKKKKEDEFLKMTEGSTEKVIIKREVKEKEAVKGIYIRAPLSYWEDLQEVVLLTGISMNAVCLELLRPGLKKKLRELKEEY